MANSKDKQCCEHLRVHMSILVQYVWQPKARGCFLQAFLEYVPSEEEEQSKKIKTFRG